MPSHVPGVAVEPATRYLAAEEDDWRRLASYVIVLPATGARTNACRCVQETLAMALCLPVRYVRKSMNRP